jgi:hypothetical protein
MTPRAAHKSRRGIALPTAIFTLVALGVLAAGLFTFADLSAKSVRNQESATRAAHVAEAAVNHTLGLMRGSLRMHSFSRILKGSDNVAGTADDSLLISWAGLAAGDQIPLAGQSYQGHTYFAKVFDDPADSDGSVTADMNGRIRVLCRAVTADGATAEVEAIIGSVPMPGIAADGNISFGNSNVISGECGGVHANGNMTSTGGGPMLSGPASATGTVTGNYNGATKVPGAPEVPIPDLNPMNFCAGTDFNLTVVGGIGYVQNATTMVSTPSPSGGWTYSNATQTWTGSGTPTLPAAGTYCAQGNVWLSGNVGSSASPKPISILATKSIRVEGTPYIQPDHADGILLMAGGDIYLAGNNTTGVNNYQGMMYAAAQCQAQGNAKAFGQLLCANGALPAGGIDWAPGNSVTGNFSLTFDCSANVFNKRRILYWYPRVGT